MVVNEDLLERQAYYKKYGKCKKHMWVECNPIKTSEGEFVITTCFVCKKSYVKYEGQKVVAQLNELIEFLVNRGLKYEKQTKKKAHTKTKTNA
jgi:hypothetical protein